MSFDLIFICKSILSFGKYILCHHGIKFTFPDNTPYCSHSPPVCFLRISLALTHFCCLLWGISVCLTRRQVFTLYLLTWWTPYLIFTPAWATRPRAVILCVIKALIYVLVKWQNKWISVLHIPPWILLPHLKRKILILATGFSWAYIEILCESLIMGTIRMYSVI